MFKPCLAYWLFSSKFWISNNARKTEDSHWFIYSTPSMKMHTPSKGKFDCKTCARYDLHPPVITYNSKHSIKDFKVHRSLFFNFLGFVMFSIQNFTLTYWHHTYQQLDKFWRLAFDHLQVLASIPLDTYHHILCVWPMYVTSSLGALFRLATMK